MIQYGILLKYAATVRRDLHGRERGLCLKTLAVVNPKPSSSAVPLSTSSSKATGTFCQYFPCTLDPCCLLNHANASERGMEKMPCGQQHYTHQCLRNHRHSLYLIVSQILLLQNKVHASCGGQGTQGADNSTWPPRTVCVFVARCL